MSHSNGFGEWGGYMDAKITKLEEQFSAASNPYRQSDLFSGISIFVNGRTDPSADELKRIMMTHGGTYHHYERTHTTFIVAENLPDVKVRQMQQAKKHIIKAKWIVDCLENGRIIDYTGYLLYTNQKTTQPRLQFNTTNASNVSNISHNTTTETTTTNNNNNNNDNSNNNNHNNNVEENNLKSNLEQLTKQMLNSCNNTTTTGNTTKTSISTKTAKDENFLTEFYNNSRLHHIATLGAGFKQYVINLREENANKDFTVARNKLKNQKLPTSDMVNNINNDANHNYIMHIDMDCFFVSVGLRKHEHLRNQPVAVTHSRGAAAGGGEMSTEALANRQAERELYMQRKDPHCHDRVRVAFDGNSSLAEIASCSYEARKCGIKNGMFVGQALKLCPNLQTIPYDFAAYKEVAYQLYDTIAQYTTDIEAVSCDELFVDLTSVLRDTQLTVTQAVSLLRSEVRTVTGCPCSAGVGPNKLLARMATKRAKPDGQFVLLETDALEYMASVPIGELPGVGGSTAHALKSAGINTCADMQAMSLERLQMLVGKKCGQTLRQFCRGIDTRPLVYYHVRKSVSAEVNYGIRFELQQEVDEFLVRLSDEVHARLMEIKRRTKCINLKLMVRAKDAPVKTAKYMGHGVCDSFSKATALNEYTNSKDVIRNSVLNSIKSMAVEPSDLRGIGIQLTKLDEPTNEESRSGGHKTNSIENLFKRAAQKQQQQQQQQQQQNPHKQQQQLNSTVINTTNNKIIEKTNNNNNSKIKRDMKSAPNVIDMLKQANVKRQRKLEDAATIHIDLTSNCEEFLDILPQTLRKEVAESVQQLQQLEMSYAAKKQRQAQTECIETKEKNIFKEADFEEAIISWLNHSSSTGPTDTDVSIIIQHAVDLLQDQANYYQLYGQLNWLCKFLANCRNVNACQWHAVGRRIKESVQQQIKLRNGMPFFIPEAEVVCNKCKEN